MLLFAALPVFVAAAAKIYGRPVRMQRAGLPFIGLAALLTAVVTIFRCSDVVESIRNVWTEPRYLAHSVRELATYPLTFFPLPLYFVFRGRNSEAIGEKRWTWGVLAGLSVLTLAGIGWQVGVSLAAGIDGLAQHPAFAVGGRLTIPYLLAAHYFEHVLDTIFFTLLCLWLLQWRVRP
jgi:hypothetical protein